VVGDHDAGGTGLSPPSAHEIARFRELLATAMGWQFDDARIDGLSQTLTLRAEALGTSCTAYLEALALAPATTGEIAALARELTVTETYFLRHADQFRALVQTALPDRLEAAPDGASIEVLSIGCASGEEPYSIAMMVREFLPAAAQRVIITGADLNPQMLERARRAHYSAWALRDLPASTVARWFHKEGTGFALDEQLVRAVRFEARNLARDDAEFWRPGRFDAIFCRNLLMYFAPEQAQAAVARLRTALAVGGYIFLGHAETLRGLSTATTKIARTPVRRRQHGAWCGGKRPPLAKRAGWPPSARPANASQPWPPAMPRPATASTMQSRALPTFPPCASCLPASATVRRSHTLTTSASLMNAILTSSCCAPWPWLTPETPTQPMSPAAR
jgi:chemotaxis methyl-accepting protein methylase